MADFPTTRLIGGVKHYYFESFVVETPGDVRDYDEPVTVTDIDEVAQEVRSVGTEEVITDLRSSATNGLAPGFWSPVGVILFGTAAQTITRTSVGYVTELAEELGTALTALGSITDLTSRLDALDGGGLGVPLLQRVEALETAGPYVLAVPGYEPAGMGVVSASSPPVEDGLLTGATFDVIL